MPLKSTPLFNGVMAAQQILVLLVKVRILVEQQNPAFAGFFFYNHLLKKTFDQFVISHIRQRHFQIRIFLHGPFYRKNSSFITSPTPA